VVPGELEVRDQHLLAALTTKPCLESHKHTRSWAKARDAFAEEELGASDYSSAIVWKVRNKLDQFKT
jgi:hypothetical protein